MGPAGETTESWFRRGNHLPRGPGIMTSHMLRKLLVAGLAVAALTSTAACKKAPAADAASDASAAASDASTAASDAAMAASSAVAASDAAMAASAAAPANK